ncbi:gephyrin-like molybdotransferase Glp [Dyella nitratireducens]|uniref:Molybdopterin molybdenumtransferase n=1 Tax=Dyella nitratireducens TaxID=1849580 RepID=A0ABQ1GLR3_9GAMM|nr:gephyrin-like molybdotransferase Glp [Dyella nitratireducens]GGA46332.1 molybdopterin molybdenumtransferase MoeA [Dyella nitratireducens]GLQ41435.1 molybdopterin molybdenumtransferase MoeA [Dyella nitratireducens]
MSQDTLAYDEALRIVLGASAKLGTEDCSLSACLGRVLAEPVISAVNLPPFDNSAMDGFALSGSSIVPAGTELAIEGEQAAGDGVVHAGIGAWEIMTGARIPDGLDRVIPVEQTERFAPSRVRLLADVTPGQNVRTAGSDVACGETLLDAGIALQAQHLMLLAALGIANVTVTERPRVAVICTGRELVDDPAQALEPGQIRNSNGPFLAARLPLAGADVVHVETVGDDTDAFESAMRRALSAGAKVIVTSGAVSMGRYDFVPHALQRLGAQTLFHKVAIRPGKPLLFARLPGDVLLFGLPGNPIAVAVGLRFFVEPALRVMLGMPRETSRRIALVTPYSKKPRLRFHLKSRLHVDAQGRLGVEVLDGQESYRIRPLAGANAWAVVPAEVDALPAGALVDVYGVGHLEFPLPYGSAA